MDYRCQNTSSLAMLKVEVHKNCVNDLWRYLSMFWLLDMVMPGLVLTYDVMKLELFRDCRRDQTMFSIHKCRYAGCRCISFTVCLFVFCVFVRLRISLARTKLVAPRQGISRFGELSSQKLPQKPNIGRIGTRWQVLPIDASPLHWRRASSARPQYLRIFDRPRRRTYLCILMIKMVRFACCRLQSVGTALTDSAHQSISGQKQSAKVEPGSVHFTS